MQVNMISKRYNNNNNNNENSKYLRFNLMQRTAVTTDFKY